MSRFDHYLISFKVFKIVHVDLSRPDMPLKQKAKRAVKPTADNEPTLKKKKKSVCLMFEVIVPSSSLVISFLQEKVKIQFSKWWKPTFYDSFSERISNSRNTSMKVDHPEKYSMVIKHNKFAFRRLGSLKVSFRKFWLSRLAPLLLFSHPCYVVGSTDVQQQKSFLYAGMTSYILRANIAQKV